MKRTRNPNSHKRAAIYRDIEREGREEIQAVYHARRALLTRSVR